MMALKVSKTFTVTAIEGEDAAMTLNLSPTVWQYPADTDGNLIVPGSGLGMVCNVSFSAPTPLRNMIHPPVYICQSINVYKSNGDSVLLTNSSLSHRTFSITFLGGRNYEDTYTVKVVWEKYDKADVSTRTLLDTCTAVGELKIEPKIKNGYQVITDYCIFDRDGLTRTISDTSDSTIIVKVFPRVTSGILKLPNALKTGKYLTIYIVKDGSVDYDEEFNRLFPLNTTLTVSTQGEDVFVMGRSDVPENTITISTGTEGNTRAVVYCGHGRAWSTDNGVWSFMEIQKLNINIYTTT